MLLALNSQVAIGGEHTRSAGGAVQGAAGLSTFSYSPEILWIIGPAFTSFGQPPANCCVSVCNAASTGVQLSFMIPLDSAPDPSLIDEAKALMRSGLGKAELEFIATITAPLFWVLRGNDRRDHMKNGSVFFLDAGQGSFAVTAAHVVTECLEDSKSSMFVQCMIGSNGGFALPIYLGDRIIDAHAGIDIATFRVTSDELTKIGRTEVTGFQRTWPR